VLGSLERRQYNVTPVRGPKRAPCHGSRTGRAFAGVLKTVTSDSRGRTPECPESVDDLVARRQYVKAVEAFYEELEGRQPTAAERLRLADLLVLAGRDEEAIPILLGVADEQKRFGFDDKALEALRRASEVQPGNPEVERRLARLQEALPSAASAAPGGADPEARPLDGKDEGHEPTAEERLREAESLVTAGRDEDAVLSLLLASDELARRGSTDEALKALKRAKKIQPGRPDVGRRIQKLREAGARARGLGVLLHERRETTTNTSSTGSMARPPLTMTR